jgi:5-formyltetrahydrofolate cyclo-ligase
VTDEPVAADPKQAKRALRDALRSSRRHRPTPVDSGERLAAAALARPDVAAASTVAAYVAVGSEPDTAALLTALWARGTQVLLPVVLPGLDLDWAEYTGPDGLGPGPRGLLEPTGARLGREAVGRADVVLVPASAVDRSGRRLGQGGGCYDRALTRVPNRTPVIAVVFAEEVVDESLPEEPHDRRVDGVVTAP